MNPSFFKASCRASGEAVRPHSHIHVVVVLDESLFADCPEQGPVDGAEWDACRGEGPVKGLDHRNTVAPDLAQAAGLGVNLVPEVFQCHFE